VQVWLAGKFYVTRLFIKRTVFLSRSFRCGSHVFEATKQQVRDAQMGLHNCNTFRNITLTNSNKFIHIVTRRHNSSSSLIVFASSTAAYAFCFAYRTVFAVFYFCCFVFARLPYFFACQFSRNYPRHFFPWGAFLYSGFNFSHYDLLFPTRYCIPFVRSGLYQLVIRVKGFRVYAHDPDLHCIRCCPSAWTPRYQRVELCIASARTALAVSAVAPS